MIEFSFVFIILMAMTLALGCLSVIGYNWMVLQYAASEGTRFGSLGQIDPGLETREASIRSRITDIAERLGVQDVQVTFENAAGDDDAGAASEIFRINITRELDMRPVLGVFFGLTNGETAGIYEVRARTVIRNEPF